MSKHRALSLQKIPTKTMILHLMPPKKDDFSLMNRDIRESFDSGVNSSYKSRLKNLNLIENIIKKYYHEACNALLSDLGRSKTEAQLELQLVLNELSFLRSHLEALMKPESTSQDPFFPFSSFLFTSYHNSVTVRKEPYGVVLIISSFNNPFQYSLIPLIGAIAAGNCVVLKPSNETKSCQLWFLNQFAPFISKDIIRVISGDSMRTTLLLNQPWDYIFFTGSRSVGKIVSHAAAIFLTPLFLQLGGKSPVYVDKSCLSTINEVAKRIIFGKFTNCGQSCDAPDYVLVHEDVHDMLLEGLIRWTKQFYSLTPKVSEDYGRLCSKAQKHQLLKLIETSGGTIVYCAQNADDDEKGDELSINRSSVKDSEGLETDDCYLPPTFIDNPSIHSHLMHSEILGPILPILSVKHDEEEEDDNGTDVKNVAGRGQLNQDVCHIIRKIDSTPTNFYIFCQNEIIINNLMKSIQSGTVVVNDTYIQTFNIPYMPSGGVGNSGYGSYRGDYSYDCFSWKRGIVSKHPRFDVLDFPFARLRYPPTGKLLQKYNKLTTKNAVPEYP